MFYISWETYRYVITQKNADTLSDQSIGRILADGLVVSTFSAVNAIVFLKIITSCWLTKPIDPVKQRWTFFEANGRKVLVPFCNITILRHCVWHNNSILENTI